MRTGFSMNCGLDCRAEVEKDGAVVVTDKMPGMTRVNGLNALLRFGEEAGTGIGCFVEGRLPVAGENERGG
jgi:hypothetical protein